ncbi:FxsA family protein [Chitinispirillales bacterium ANBcel5]|uniref:FxsA family protein n=1 Tax=Cellulosispirillum alkaliphilum TaxID=3039283 RepID=UPI002A531BB3|nr:FxsA family protein [Chitinispirillales bacterium ANBcel5]
MFLRLLLLFTIFPLIELALLIYIGGLIGALNTILIVIATAFIGAALAKAEGLSTLLKIRTSMAKGQIPAEEILDGFLILIAAVVLITPGLITDLLGFGLLIRPTRKLFKRYLKKTIKRKIDKGSMEIRMH